MAHTNDISKLLVTDTPVYEVIVLSALGSTPRDAGSWMLVSAAHSWGTIGGGQLEKIALEKVVELIAEDRREAHDDIPLGPDIGQCCGGRVGLRYIRLSQTAKDAIKTRVEKEITNQPHLYIFGAGHTGRALALCCELLPVRCIVVDQREDEMALLPKTIEKRLTALPEVELKSAPAGSAFVVMTHDHALDFLITFEALARQDAAYVGMIGSKTKRAKFKSWIEENGPQNPIDALQCPMAAHAKGDKRPAVIASVIAAEIMVAFARVNGS